MTMIMMRNILRSHRRHQSRYTPSPLLPHRVPLRDVHLFSRQFIPINHTPPSQQQQQQQVAETNVEQTPAQQHIVRGQQLLLQAGFIRQVEYILGHNISCCVYTEILNLLIILMYAVELFRHLPSPTAGHTCHGEDYAHHRRRAAGDRMSEAHHAHHARIGAVEAHRTLGIDW